jgi:hypothetical protein
MLNYDLYSSFKNLQKTRIFYAVITLYRTLAENIDNDKSGNITEEELLSWIEKNHIAYVIRRSREFFEETDEDNDGFVTFDEYEKGQYQNGELIDSNLCLSRGEMTRIASGKKGRMEID